MPDYGVMLLIGLFGLFLSILLLFLTIGGLWKTFSKAGYPGWASLIPIYNLYVLLRIAQKPLWWMSVYAVALVVVVILNIPSLGREIVTPVSIISIVNYFVALIMQLLVSISIARLFGKGMIFGIFLLWLFPVVGYAIIGFGNAKYLGKQEQKSEIIDSTQKQIPEPPLITPEDQTKKIG